MTKHFYFIPIKCVASSFRQSPLEEHQENWITVSSSSKKKQFNCHAPKEVHAKKLIAATLRHHMDIDWNHNHH